jgi:molybdopterin synthase catalytic subunit
MEATEKHVRTGLSAEPLDVVAVLSEVASPDCGGIGVFLGTVRISAAVDANQDKAVVRLDYEAHEEHALKRLGEIAQEATTKWDVKSLVAIHRTGGCELGEPTVIVACAAPHRGDALEACRWTIDELKATVPIWKKEVYADGSAWVGTEHDPD